MQKVLRYLSMPVVWIVAALVLLFVVVFKFFFHSARTYGPKYIPNGNNLGRHERFYKSVADQLETAMQGLGNGSSVVIPLLQDLNNDELKQVSNEFGLRYRMDAYFGKIFGWSIGTPSYEPIDLQTWLMHEFIDTSDWKYVKERINGLSS